MKFRDSDQNQKKYLVSRAHGTSSPDTSSPYLRSPDILSSPNLNVSYLLRTLGPPILIPDIRFLHGHHCRLRPAHGHRQLVHEQQQEPAHR